MKDSALPWILVAILAALAFAGRSATVQAFHFAMALVHPSPSAPPAPDNGFDASKAITALQAEKTSDASMAQGQESEPYVFYLRAPVDVNSDTGPHHLPTGTRVKQVSEDHSGTCTVDDGTNRFTVDFAQLTQYQKVAELLRAKEMYPKR